MTFLNTLTMKTVQYSKSIILIDIITVCLSIISLSFLFSFISLGILVNNFDWELNNDGFRLFGFVGGIASIFALVYYPIRYILNNKLIVKFILLSLVSFGVSILLAFTTYHNTSSTESGDSIIVLLSLLKYYFFLNLFFVDVLILSDQRLRDVVFPSKKRQNRVERDDENNRITIWDEKAQLYITVPKGSRFHQSFILFFKSRPNKSGFTLLFVVFLYILFQPLYLLFGSLSR